MHPLDSARAKLTWAQEHLNTLEQEVRAFFGAHPYPVSHEVDRATGYHRWKVELGRPLPDRWPLIAGDCAHNVRSALDHLAWQLAGAQPDDRTTQFPIFIDPDLFRSVGLRQIRPIPPRPQALIKWLQPHRRADPPHDPLWTLQVLDAEDKHKTLTLALGVTEEVELQPVIPPYSRLKHELGLIVGPFDTSIPDAVIAEGPFIAYPLKGGPPNTDVEVNLELSFGVAIRAETAGLTIMPAQLVMAEIIGCVKRVLTLFERYF